MAMTRNHTQLNYQTRQTAPLSPALRGGSLCLLLLTVFSCFAPFADAHARSSRGSRSSRARAHEALTRGHETPVRVGSAQEAKARINELDKKRAETKEMIRIAREKEQQAMRKLNSIRSHLNETTTVLNSHQHRLKNTVKTLVHVETNIKSTVSQEQNMETQASNRLREMYEGQRLGLLDMLFQVNSLQQLMDLLYYQERVAELDKVLISSLRAKAAALSAQKSKLGQQKMQLGDIVSEFAKKALQLNKEKSDQEVVAEKLRSQRAFYEAAERQLSRESGQLQQQILQMVRASESRSTSDNRVVTKGSGTMSLPIHAPVTSPFGYRRHPIFGVKRFHTGVDLAGKNHTPIHAADSGNVLYSGYYGGYGKVVIISHGNGFATLYAHMSKAAVGEGQNVSKGDVVGYEGSTGFSTGPHLHFEVRIDGKPQNPLNYAR